MFSDRLDEFRNEIEGDFIVPIEAEHFLHRMQREHPAELKEWMQGQALHFIGQALRDAERRERSRALRRAGARSFAVAAESADEDALKIFRLPFVVDEDYTRRHLGDMRGVDCRFAAAKYETSAKRSLALASFLKALGKRAGAKKVSDVMSEETAEKLLRSLIGSEGDALAA